MTTNTPNVNDERAPIKNLAICLGVVRSLQNRHPSQPNLGMFVGFSGYGKSVSTLFCQNKTGAAVIEMSSSWTRKDFLSTILEELGVFQPRGRLAQMEEEIIGILARDPKRPLIIDEADILVQRNMAELLRGIAKKSNVPVLLVGEELLPKKIAPLGDRFRDLFLVTQYAQPCDLDDCRALARTFYPELSISDDLLEEARSAGDGRVRRIVSSLHAIAENAGRKGTRAIDLSSYSDGNGRFSRSYIPSRQEVA